MEGHSVDPTDVQHIGVQTRHSHRRGFIGPPAPGYCPPGAEQWQDDQLPQKPPRGGAQPT